MREGLVKARIILVLPIYNESSTVGEVLREASPYCDLMLAIDDGSSDHTHAILEQYRREHPHLTIASHSYNRGMSEAILTAFLIIDDALREGMLSLEDVVVLMDSDGQHDPKDIPRLLAGIQTGQSDLVVGRRGFEQYPWIKRLGNWGLSWWASVWSEKTYHDAECGFRALHMAFLVDLLPYFNPTQYGWAQEMDVIAGLRGWRIQSDVAIRIRRYRKGARPIHGLNNARSALAARCRVLRHDRIVRPPGALNALDRGNQAFGLDIVDGETSAGVNQEPISPG